MTNSAIHTLRKTGLSLLLVLALLVLLAGGAGVGVAEGQEIRLSTLKIRVVDSTPQHKPRAGVTLSINESEYVDYYHYHVRTETSDADGLIAFDLNGLSGKFVILHDLSQNYDPYTYDLIVNNGRLVSIEGTAPDSADFCFELMVVPENFSVTLDANGGTINGEPYYTYESKDANHLVWGQETDGMTAYVKIAYDVLTPEPEGTCQVSGPKGYELDGWYTQRVGGTAVEELDTKFYEERTTIYAHWGRNIRFNANGGNGSMGAQRFIHGVSQSLSPNSFTHPDGLHFVGWNTRADGTGTSYGDADEITSPTFGTLYAQWAGESVTVLVDSSIRNGTVAADNTLAEAGATVTLTLTPDKGSEYVQESLSVMQGDTAIATVKQSDTQWTFTMPQGQVAVSARFAPISYTISFAPDAHGSVGLYQPQDSFHYGDRVILTFAPEKGYELSTVKVTDFAGNDVPLNNNYFSMPDSNVIVSGTFVPSEFEITLRYKGTGHYASVPSTARTGETVTITSNPGYHLSDMMVTGEDATFIAHSSTPSKTLTFTMPPQNVTVLVNCSINFYYVYADVSDGGHITRLEDVINQRWSYKHGFLFDVVPDPGKELRELRITSDQGDVPIQNHQFGTYGFQMPASDVTIHVVFRGKQSYTVAYYDADTKLGDVSVKDGMTVYEEQRPRVQAPKGQAFLGWYDENGSYFSPDEEITRNVTLKAKYGPAVDSLKFHVTDPLADNKPLEGCTVSIVTSDMLQTIRTQTTDSEGNASFKISDLPAYVDERIKSGKKNWTKRSDVTYKVRFDFGEQYLIETFDLRLVKDSSGKNRIASFMGNREEGPQACYEIQAVLKDSGASYYDDPTEVTTLTLPENTRKIEAYAFENTSMAVVYVPDSCMSIGEYAFRNCRNLFLVRLPKDCVIDKNAFSGLQVFVTAPAGGTTEDYCQTCDNVEFIAEG